MSNSLGSSSSTHSLQIYCIGLIRPRSHTSWAWVSKMCPYINKPSFTILCNIVLALGIGSKLKSNAIKALNSGFMHSKLWYVPKIPNPNLQSRAFHFSPIFSNNALSPLLFHFSPPPWALPFLLSLFHSFVPTKKNDFLPLQTLIKLNQTPYPCFPHLDLISLKIQPSPNLRMDFIKFEAIDGLYWLWN